MGLDPMSLTLLTRATRRRDRVLLYRPAWGARRERRRLVPTRYRRAPGLDVDALGDGLARSTSRRITSSPPRDFPRRRLRPAAASSSREQRFFIPGTTTTTGFHYVGRARPPAREQRSAARSFTSAPSPAPGLRLGFVVAPPPSSRRLTARAVSSIGRARPRCVSALAEAHRTGECNGTHPPRATSRWRAPRAQRGAPSPDARLRDRLRAPERRDRHLGLRRSRYARTSTPGPSVRSNARGSCCSRRVSSPATQRATSPPSRLADARTTAPRRQGGEAPRRVAATEAGPLAA